MQRLTLWAWVLITLAMVSLAAAAGDKYGDAAFFVEDGGSNSIHDAGLYHLRLWNECLFAFVTGGDGNGRYPGTSGSDTLYGGEFWVGTNSWGSPRVINGSYYSIREWYPLQGLLWSDNSNWSQRPNYITTRGTLDSYLRINDSRATENGPIGLVVEQQGMQWNDAANDDYIIFKYLVTNNSGRNLTDVHYAYYWDFDIGGEGSHLDDVTGLDTSRHMPYMYDSVSGHPYAGFRILDGTARSGGVLDIFNDPDHDPGRWKMMIEGRWEYATNPYDYRLILAGGPLSINAGARKTVALAVVAGANLAALQSNADAAYNKYWGIFTGIDDFRARALPGEIELTWTPNTTYAGFNLYRSTADGRREAVNRTLITGSSPYRYLDADVVGGTPYRYNLEAVTLNGMTEVCGNVSVMAKGRSAPAAFTLASSFPNPANDKATIAFSLATPGHARIDLFDVTGRKIATVADGDYGLGEHTIAINTNGLAAGVYVYRLEAGGLTAAKRLAISR
jgi:hypothetical protein